MTHRPSSAGYPPVLPPDFPRPPFASNPDLDPSAALLLRVEPAGSAAELPLTAFPSRAGHRRIAAEGRFATA